MRVRGLSGLRVADASITVSVKPNATITMIGAIRAHGYDVPLGGIIDQDAPGNVVPVTVVDNPPDDSRIAREEPFGPVLPILSFRDTDEVVAIRDPAGTDP